MAVRQIVGNQYNINKLFKIKYLEAASNFRIKQSEIGKPQFDYLIWVIKYTDYG